MPARAQPDGGSDNMKSLRIRDPDVALKLLETRLGRMPARQRLDIERDHEAKDSGQGLTLHIKPMIIAAILRATVTYWWAPARARRLQRWRTDSALPGLPKAFDGFTILHLSAPH